jgi:hypothetical protein
VLGLYGLNVIVTVGAVALFVIGEAAFGVTVLVGLAFGLVGLVKLRRAFRSASSGVLRDFWG